jgi:hypothetical protein
VSSSISEQLVRQSVVPMACTIPPEMTIAQWRQQRALGPKQKGRRLGGILAAASRLAAPTAAPCDHVHDSTTRYDHDQKLLTFLLICPVCGTEKVIETQHHERRFEPSPARRADAADGPPSTNYPSAGTSGRRAAPRRTHADCEARMGIVAAITSPWHAR